MPDTPALSLPRRLLAAGSHPDDNEELSLRKALLVLCTGLISIALALWQGIHYVLEPHPQLLVPMLFQGLLGGNFLLYRHKGNFPPFCRTQFGLILLFPFLILWGHGDFIAAAGLLAWALVAPVGIMLCIGPRESLPWFGAYLGLAVLGAGAGLGGLQGATPPAITSASIVCLVADLVLVACVLYLLLHYGISTKGKTRERLREAHRQLHLEQEHSERLLLNILPAPVAARLKQGGGTLADGFPEVIVMFADIVDFTRIASDMEPTKVFEMLNQVFCRFDELADQRGLERIKTIGDAYMVAGGLHAHPNEPHASMASLALDMQAALREHTVADGLHLELRIGIASGPVVAGVVGHGRFIYDLWGDTVNMAHRLCTECDPSQIQCDSRMFERIKDAFVFAKPVLMFLKGKGYVPVYRLRSPRIIALRTDRGKQPTRAA